MPSKTVWVVHPDLGIGGAEMLIVNACVALLQGHDWDVQVYTSYHDPGRCFAETLPTGALGGRIHVHGGWIPRTLFGRFHVVCAMMRMAWVSLVLTLLSWFWGKPDVILCDQVSHVVPLLRHGIGVPVVFYCHFPDKLLCVDRGSFIKRLYRAPIDKWEESTTGASDSIVVNSKFTASIFRQSFTSLSNVHLRVLYPSIDMKQFDRELSKKARDEAEGGLPQELKDFRKENPGGVVLTSINRFERKKNLLLAIEALTHLDKELLTNVHLVLAGGYDDRLEENVSYMNELVSFVESHNLQKHVSFLKSFSNDQRLVLIELSRCVVYTPDKEHFGIVPIEAMYAGCPVVAVASGGPLETVVHGKTGFLLEQTPSEFANAISKLVRDAPMAEKMGLNGKSLVSEKFSLDAFGKQLDGILMEQVRRNHSISRLMFPLAALVALFATLLLMTYIKF